MGIQPQDWRAEVFEDERLEKDYHRALKDGDTGRAQALARQIGERQEHGRREGARTVARIESVKPRRPQKGEETRLNRSLERIGKETEKLTKRKATLLGEAADRPTEKLFSQLQGIDAILQRLNYEREGVEQRLNEISRYQELEASRRKQEAESAARQKAEQERGEKIARLDALARETAKAWGVVTQNLATIRRTARELDLPEARWLNGILEQTGAVESIAPVCGLGSGAWVFPRPI